MTDYHVDPTMAEVQQEEAPALPIVAVPVRVDGVVRVQELPAQSGSVRSVVLDADGRAVRVAKPDARRKRLRLLASGQPVYFGYDQATADSPVAGVLPVGVVLAIEPRDAELWVRSATAATAATLTVINDQWTQ